MKQDRFFISILVGIVALVVVALVVFFVRKDTQVYVADDNPAGVVQNYVVAIYKHDYEKAYDYLADLPNKPSLEQFQQPFISHNMRPEDTALELGKVEITGNNATVALNINNSPRSPFENRYTNTDYAQLINQNGVWRIKLMPYNFWLYDWYTPTPKP